MKLLTKKFRTGMTGGVVALILVASPFVASANTHMATTVSVRAQLSSILSELEDVLRGFQGELDGGDMPTEDVDSPAADLRATMNNLLTRHVSVNVQVNRDIIDEADSLEASTDAEYANSMAIAAAIGSIYGEEAQEGFETLFDEHLEASNNIAMAIDESNESAEEEAIEELEEYLHDIAGFLSGAIDGLSEETAYTVLRKHESLVNEATRAWAEGDYAESYEIEQEALKQVSTIADVLSSGIVGTFPDKF